MSEMKFADRISLLRLAFHDLAEDELRQMAEVSRVCSYPVNHVLCREGAYEDIFYIVAEGSVVISKKISEAEGERVLRIASRGDLIGEMALIQNVPRAATVRAIAPLTVLEMGKQDFEAMLGHSPAMAINIIRITLDRLRANDQKAIQELQKTNKTLRLLDRNKLEFIQVAAHELRTPLTVLKGYINLLASMDGVKNNAALGGIIEGINKGVSRLHEIVNAMLDVTRIDNETLKISFVPAPIKRIFSELAGDFAPALAERNIELVVEQDAAVPVIHAEPVLLHKALSHLIVNAIKYTPDGGKVTLRSRGVTLENGLPGVEFSVKDTGIGLDAEHHELVFEKFYQVGDVALHSSGKTAFKSGGPGLGLAIVRGVARAHGGKVWVESAGHDETNFPGCAFYMQLPLTPPSQTDSLSTG